MCPMLDNYGGYWTVYRILDSILDSTSDIRYDYSRMVGPMSESKATLCPHNCRGSTRADQVAVVCP